MSDNLISVIVPAYNCAKWLPACLDSILGQTWKELEIVVVNDGSSDETAEIMTEYEHKDSRIHCIHKENGGVTSARLRGVAEAGGRWIGFADGDDILLPDMLDRLMNNAQNYGADISHCGFHEIRPDGSVIQMHGTGILKEQDRITALQDLLEERIVEPSLCTKLFKKELFCGLEEKMPRDIRNNEDMLMNFCLFSKAEKAVLEDICLYQYLIHPGSASRSSLNEHILFDPIRVRQIILETCQPELRDDAMQALVRICLVSYRMVAVERDAKFTAYQKKLRSMIAELQPHCKCLGRRNAVLVLLISRAPGVFDLLYPPFERLFR